MNECGSSVQSSYCAAQLYDVDLGNECEFAMGHVK